MSNGSEEAVQSGPAVSLENPFSSPVTDNAELGRYEATLQRGAELRRGRLSPPGRQAGRDSI